MRGEGLGVGIRAVPETLLDLAARVERGTGSDRELDGAIYDAFCLDQSVSAAQIVRGGVDPNWLPRYTSSLDFVTDLLERVLPGWKWELHSQGGAVLSVEQAGELHEVIAGHASSPARALLAATLRALADAHKNQRTTP